MKPLLYNLLLPILTLLLSINQFMGKKYPNNGNISQLYFDEVNNLYFYNDHIKKSLVSQKFIIKDNSENKCKKKMLQF